MLIQPIISEEILQCFPKYRALSIGVEASEIKDTEFIRVALNSACHIALRGEPKWAEAHLQEWSEAFKQFGAKPKKTPCSAEALRKRVLRDGSMDSIDPIVDIYNAISIKYALPVGGEDLAAYVGSPRLKIADGTEIFDTIKEGEVVKENPEIGEVIWCDEEGVTCRRWNWRQGLRTRLSKDSKKMWFILESLSSMPLSALNGAGEEFTEMIKKMMPKAHIESELMGNFSK